MKKTIATAIIAIFVLSLIPIAFAEDASADSSAETTASAQTTTGASGQNTNSNAGVGIKARMTAREDMREKNKERLQKIADIAVIPHLFLSQGFHSLAAIFCRQRSLFSILADSN